MRKEMMLEIQRKVIDMRYIDVINENIKAVSEALKVFYETPDKFYEIYTMCDYNLEEEEFFLKMLKMQKKLLKQAK